jgi:hypothetical protein
LYGPQHETIGKSSFKKIIEWRSKSVHISSGNFFAVKSKGTYIAIDFGGANIVIEYVHLIDCCSPTRIKPTKLVSDASDAKISGAIFPN